VSQVVALVDDPDGIPYVVLFDASESLVHDGADLAGQPTASLELEQAAVLCLPAPFGRESYFWHGALVRTAQLAGALEAVAHLTRHYTGERVQFGRPIGTYQAVQQHIVAVVQAAEIVSVSLWRAAQAYARRSATFEVCSAKLVANESARISARAAHQAHGAIGMTREYPLQLYTRRLNLWRQQFGTERQLSLSLGKGVCSAPSFSRALSDYDNSMVIACPTT